MYVCVFSVLPAPWTHINYNLAAALFIVVATTAAATVSKLLPVFFTYWSPPPHLPFPQLFVLCFRFSCLSLTNLSSGECNVLSGHSAEHTSFATTTSQLVYDCIQVCVCVCVCVVAIFASTSLLSFLRTWQSV